MSDPFDGMSTFNVAWTDTDGSAQVTALSLGARTTPVDPTLPMVMLLHGGGGDINHMANPQIAAGLPGAVVFDLAAPVPAPGTVTDRGWHYYPGLLYWSIGFDPKKTVTGWQPTLNNLGFRTFNYAQLDPNDHIARPVRELSAVVRAILATCRKRIIFLCHSRGGLVFRMFLQANRGDVALLQRIGGAVTLHSPHQGSQVADFAGALHNWIMFELVMGNTLALLLLPVDYEATRPSVAELSPTSQVLTTLANQETVQLPVPIPIHTFGGTNPRLTKLRTSAFLPISQMAEFHWPPFHWVTIENNVGMLDETPAAGICPEERAGGDVLVTDARSHLPGEVSHHSNPLNHAAALWAESLASQVTPILRSLVVSNAVWAGTSVPQVMNPGTSYNASITMQNTGTTTWIPTGTNPFRLGTPTPEDNWIWGSNRQNVLGAVLPGTQTTFSFPVNAPTTPGTYYFQWQMLQEAVEWFGTPTPATVVQVTAPVSGLTVAPATVTAGQNVTGTVTLIAPPNFVSGQDVMLTSSDTSTIAVPSTINVPSDRATTVFTAITRSVAAARTVTLIASAGGRSATATVTVNPAPVPVPVGSLQMNPPTIVSRQSTTGTITLTAAALAGGTTVTLSSSNPAVLSVPPTVTVAAGSSTTAFGSIAGAVSAATVITLTAAAGGASTTASVTVTPAATSSAGFAGATSGIGSSMI
jgi:pimeloyl-ACP methyl ester carboxylesterase